MVNILRSSLDYVRNLVYTAGLAIALHGGVNAQSPSVDQQALKVLQSAKAQAQQVLNEPEKKLTLDEQLGQEVENVVSVAKPINPNNNGGFNLRLWSNTAYTSSPTIDNTLVTNNLARVEYEGFRFGYRRIDNSQVDDAKEAFGLWLPIEKILGTEMPITLIYNRSELGPEPQNEFLLRVKPDEHWDAIARWSDFEVDDPASGKDGFSAGLLYRTKDPKEPDSMGASLYAATDVDHTLGASAWARIKELDGLFVGVNRSLVDTRYIIGQPSDGGFAWRYMRTEADTGAETDQVLLTTASACLKPIDFFNPLHPNQKENSFTTGGGVFPYQVPPVSAIGTDFNLGITHRKTPEGTHSLEGELDKYLSSSFFLGVHYKALLDDLGRGTIGVPFGFKIAGGDGGTRNFIRFEPFYNLQTQEYGVYAAFEMRL